MKSKQTEISLFISSIIPAFKNLRRKDPLRMGGATAFFTTFALPPIVFIIARIFGLFVDPKTVGRGLIENLSHNLGEQGAQQVRGVIISILTFNQNEYMIIFGFLFLVFVATTLFLVIKDSLDDIYEVRVDTHAGIVFNLVQRLKSFAVILIAGVLFFANLFLSSMESVSGHFIEQAFENGSFYFHLIFSEVTSVLIVSTWFIIIFRFLADARPPWKATIIGGLLTGLLFTGGRYILRILLIKGNLGALYGPSGSIVLVLLFVFYTSLIMYFGASFIFEYSKNKGWQILPSRGPVHKKDLDTAP